MGAWPPHCSSLPPTWVPIPEQPCRCAGPGSSAPWSPGLQLGHLLSACGSAEPQAILLCSQAPAALRSSGHRHTERPLPSHTATLCRCSGECCPRPELDWRGQAGAKGQGQAWVQALGRGPRGCPGGQLLLMGCVREAEMRFPGRGSKQVELVANYRGSQHVPREAPWAGPGR